MGLVMTFYDLLVVLVPRTDAGARYLFQYKWPWIRLESTNRIDIGGL